MSGQEAHAVPELSRAARGLCGAMFALGERSSLSLDIQAKGGVSKEVVDELLSAGIVVRRGGLLRGTDLAKRVGRSLFSDLHAQDHCSCLQAA